MKCSRRSLANNPDYAQNPYFAAQSAKSLGFISHPWNLAKIRRRVHFVKGIVSTLITAIALVPLPVQAQSPQDPQCFSIHVRLNGARLDDPQVIILKSKQVESTAYLEEGCFKVPAALLAEKALDVSFTVSQGRIYLTAIATGFFAGPWDIDLADKNVGGSGLPKHVHAKEACKVVFHVGEPERELIQAPCRSPL